VIAKGVVEALDDLRRTGTASRRTASPGAT